MALNEYSVKFPKMNQRGLLIMYFDLIPVSCRRNRTDQVQWRISVQPQATHVPFFIKVI